MSSEKIGSSVLGYDTSSGMSPKKKKKLELKFKEELAKKKQKDAEEEKLPKLPIPGDSPPEPIPGNADWDKIVHDEHYRKKPKKKTEETSLFEEIF